MKIKVENKDPNPKDIPVKTTKTTLSGLDMPRVALPEYSDWGDTLQWIRKENMPGSFPNQFVMML